MKRTILLRKIIQIFALVLFLITVLQANYPFNPWIPPELFLWLDPLAGLTTMIAAREFIPWFLLSLIVLISALVVGRGFCGWICPLGTTIDITDKIIAPKKKKKEIPTRKIRFLKTLFLLVFVIAAIIGWQFTWLFDPIPLLWRTFGAVIFPAVTWSANTSFNLLLDLGIEWDFLFDSYDFITLHVLPLENVAVTGAWIVAMFFLVILGLSKLSKRFWCRYLCPLGALLGLVGKVSFLQRYVESSSCTDCKKCVRHCKMDAIEDDYITTEKAECIFCLNCSAECTLGDTSFTLKNPANMISPVDLKRRTFIVSSAGSVVGAGAVNLLHDTEWRSKYLIRPPGAAPEEEFLDLCIRCNECVRICTTTGQCLQPIHFEAGAVSFWTPAADFNVGYCEFNCNLCGEICPTDAIRSLSLDFKKARKMGLAVINEDLCLPFKDKENCIVCEEHCPTAQKAIEFRERETIIVEGEEVELLKPYVRKCTCIGCGICEIKCPVEGEKAIRIVRDTEVRK